MVLLLLCPYRSRMYLIFEFSLPAVSAGGLMILSDLIVDKCEQPEAVVWPLWAGSTVVLHTMIFCRLYFYGYLVEKARGLFGKSPPAFG